MVGIGDLRRVGKVRWDGMGGKGRSEEEGKERGGGGEGAKTRKGRSKGWKVQRRNRAGIGRMARREQRRRRMEVEKRLTTLLSSCELWGRTWRGGEKLTPSYGRASYRGMQVRRKRRITTWYTLQVKRSQHTCN